MTKQEQRTIAQAARAQIPAEQKIRFSRQICERLMQFVQLRQAHLVFSYLATPEEANLKILHDFLRSRGTEVAFPYSERDGRMQAYIPDEEDPLAPGLLGIRAPDPARARLADPTEIDVVIVPCIAFDEECNRLGHGGGYYDRYLLRCTRATRAVAAFEAQKLPRVETEEHDAPADLVVTEERFYLNFR